MPSHLKRAEIILRECCHWNLRAGNCISDTWLTCCQSAVSWHFLVSIIHCCHPKDAPSEKESFLLMLEPFSLPSLFHPPPTSFVFLSPSPSLNCFKNEIWPSFATPVNSCETFCRVNGDEWGRVKNGRGNCFQSRLIFNRSLQSWPGDILQTKSQPVAGGYFANPSTLSCGFSVQVDEFGLIIKKRVGWFGKWNTVRSAPPVAVFVSIYCLCILCCNVTV